MHSDSNASGDQPSVGASDPPPVPRDLPRNPVPPSSKGSGWPYAPQGWPNPDDKWGWKVGKRAAANSLWIDRYVSVPVRMQQGRRGIEFASRKSLEEYCKTTFPQMTDAANIFKAFDWKIPAPPGVEVYDAKRASTAKGEAIAKEAQAAKGEATAKEAQAVKAAKGGAPAKVAQAARAAKGEAIAKEAQLPPTGAQEALGVNKRPASANFEAVDGERRKKKSKKSRKLKKRCRAGNLHCTLVKGKTSGSEIGGRLVCHICCVEPDFCRECNCILCCELLQQPNASAAAVVRCGHMPVPGQGSCGHAAHLECALNAQLAGVVEKSGVDIEYRCRRCDWKTDLKATVIDMVGALSQNAPQAETALQLALRIVQGSDDGPRIPPRAWAVSIGGALEKIRAGAATSEVSTNLTLELNRLEAGAVSIADAPGKIRTGAATSEASENLTSGLQAGTNGDVLGGDGALVQGASGVSDQVSHRSRATKQDTTHDPLTICIQPRRDTTSQVDKYLEWCRDVASRLKQSVCMPPRLLLEDHISECQAMAERVRGAACEFTILPSSTKFCKALLPRKAHEESA